MFGTTGIEILDKPTVGDLLVWELLVVILVIWYASYSGHLGASYQTTYKDPISYVVALFKKDDGFRGRR